MGLPYRDRLALGGALHPSAAHWRSTQGGTSFEEAVIELIGSVANAAAISVSARPTMAATVRPPASEL